MFQIRGVSICQLNGRFLLCFGGYGICLVRLVLSCFFFFKQKTAYDMRISDWSSDVCSSDLVLLDGGGVQQQIALLPQRHLQVHPHLGGEQPMLQRKRRGIRQRIVAPDRHRRPHPPPPRSFRLETDCKVGGAARRRIPLIKRTQSLDRGGPVRADAKTHRADLKLDFMSHTRLTSPDASSSARRARIASSPPSTSKSTVMRDRTSAASPGLFSLTSSILGAGPGCRCVIPDGMWDDAE